MKVSTSLLTFGSLLSLFALVNCGGGGGNPEPIADQQFTKLSKTWVVSQVSLEGTDRTAEYQAGVGTDAGPMKLTISGTKGTPPFTYSVSGRPVLSPWLKTGKWEFGTTPASQIIRDKDSATDILNMTYAVDGTTLQITFNFNGAGYPNPRVSEVAGAWTFKFNAAP